MLKQCSQSFTQCLVFPQHQHASGRAFAFLAASISMGTGLPGVGVECGKRKGRMPRKDIEVSEFEEVEVDVTQAGLCEA